MRPVQGRFVLTRTILEVCRLGNQAIRALVFGTVLLAPFSFVPLYAADDSVCARVKIEIKQELTLERQAFDAHMRINNGLSHITLDNVDIEVSFADESGASILATSDPNNTDALFFIRLDTMTNISGIQGAGTVSPSTSADIHWLIIPAPGASRGVPSGTLYYVGATLRYTIGGEEHVTQVTPDYIFVKPMPELTLDYFIPIHVYGDDAFTPEIEPSVPFSLGVRVANNGTGTARALKINSAQPRITENQLGLLIDFAIQGCQVNGSTVSPSLLVDFGDIGANSAKVARWIMTCSLSGTFVEFTADFSHSDELGGELTSLLQATNTHFLVREVMVDVAGKDTVPDFLAKDGDVYRVFESENIDTVVTDQSSSSTVAPAGGSYRLTTPVTAGFMYVSVPDPTGGLVELGNVVRSDGKYLKRENAWISKIRNENHQWDYYLNLFDANSTGSYTVSFVESVSLPHSPVMQFIPDRTVEELRQLSFIVEATDQDGTIPSISALSLPALASFVDQGDGTGIFSWTPALGQAGDYQVTFIASDGALEHTRSVIIQVIPAGDSDTDGMPDDWEMQYFGTLGHDGTGDFDGDGIPDMEEYLRGSDPTVPNQAPEVPVITSPADLSEAALQQPSLTVQASADPDGDAVVYTFQLYADEEMAAPIVQGTDIDSTSWTPPITLSDNAWYCWRVRASDGYANTVWSYGRFFVNMFNDAPGAFQVSSPSGFDTRTPVLEVTNSTDADGDVLTYAFQVYSDASCTTLVTSVSGIAQGPDGTTSWMVDTPLDNDTTYYWKATATDEHGFSTETVAASFLVDISNNAPSAPSIHSPAPGSEVASTEVDLVVANAVDNEWDTLTYVFELDTVSTFDSPDFLTQGEVPEQETTTSCHAEELADNTLYYWRVRADDGMSEGEWCTGSFFVNTANDAPSGPVLKNPADQAWVNTFTPTLEIFPSSDADRDAITYTFEVYADADLETPVVSGGTDACSWTLPISLDDSAWYTWRVTAEDEHGKASPSMQTARFFVNSDGIDDAPVLGFVQPMGDVSTNAESFEIVWDDQDPDSNATISLYYAFDGSGTGGYLIADSIQEDPDGEADRYLWDLAGLADDTYYLYAVIADSTTSVTVTCPYAITIDRVPPVALADPPAGTYTSVQSVTLTANEPADIYYTLDGTDPDTTSIQYTGPIEISADTTVKFYPVDLAGNAGEVSTAAYVISQSPQELYVVVKTSSGSAIAGVRVYAFTEVGSYTGLYAVTEENGIARFDMQTLGTGSFTFRADYLGSQFWSGGITLPRKASLSAGWAHTVGVRTDGTVVTVGNNEKGQCNVNDWTDIVQTSAGLYHTVGLRSDGTVVAVGFNMNGQCNVNDWTDIVQVSASGAHTVGLRTDGTVVAVGTNSAGQCNVSGWTDIVQIAAGDEHTVGLKSDGTVVSVGSNMDGQRDVGVWTDIVQISAGSYNTAGLKSDGTVVIVGSNYDSQCNVGSWTDIVQVSVGTSHTIGLRSDGTVLATGTTVSQDDVDDWSDIIQIDAGWAYAVGLRSDNTAVAAIWNGYGQCNVEDWNLTAEAGPSVDIVIEEETVDVQVTTAAGPVAEVRVYLYSSTGAYLGTYLLTDPLGTAMFMLPAGHTYIFRTDILGSQYWSDPVHVQPGGANTVLVDAGGGTYTITVRKDLDSPLAGLNVYLFNQAGSYLGLFGTTDSTGMVGFNVPEGTYKVRVDYLGYQFWSIENEILDDTAVDVTIDHQDVEISVDGFYLNTTTALAGVQVHLFTSGGSYLGRYMTTDAGGLVVFSLPDKPYKVRADYLGRQYFSDEFTWAGTGVEIPFAEAQITVLGSGMPQPGVSVFVFNDQESYLGISGTTNADGQILFSLPEGSYNFRADYSGNQYWSDDQTLLADQTNPVDINVGGGPFSLTVLKGANDPLAGVVCYVFNEAGAFLGLSGTTDDLGEVGFDLPSGSYRFRIDYLGAQFWTGIQAVPATLEHTEIITHQDIVITVAGDLGPDSRPLQSIPVYLYSADGSYLSISAYTDGNGQVTFNLPDMAFKARADYLGKQYFSDEFTWQDTTVSIPEGTARVLVNIEGAPLGGVPVYVYSSTDSYLGITGTTSSQGIIELCLPEGTYKFRADYQGGRFWISSGIAHDMVNEVDLNTGGGEFTLVVDAGQSPLVGARVYLFTEAGSSLGMSSTTDEAGQVRFVLSSGRYKFRVDHLGYQFWSEVFEVPLALSGLMSIPHQNLTVSVDGYYLQPLAKQGISVYLFSASDSYLGQTLATGADGTVTFLLPDRQYQVRANYLGHQFWSEVFQSQNAAVTIDEGLLRIFVTRSGAAQEGARIYLYSESDAYLGLYETTDVSGAAEFILPNLSFRFRIDQGSTQTWTPPIVIREGQEQEVEVDLDE